MKTLSVKDSNQDWLTLSIKDSGGSEIICFLENWRPQSQIYPFYMRHNNSVRVGGNLGPNC